MTRPTGPVPDPLEPALSRWLDDECDADEARRVEARLAADPSLAAEVAHLRAAMDAFREDASAAAPRGLAERVLESASHGEDENERFRVVARRYAAAAAVLLAVGIAGSVWAGGTNGAAGSATPPSIRDLVEGQMRSEQYVALDELPVGGR